jgi:hypothetical protein
MPKFDTIFPIDELLHNENGPAMKLPWQLRILLLFFPALLLPDTGLGEPGKTSTNFYQAELVCPAVPKIGCGSAAKPLLIELERDAHVKEAWLNRAGTIVAVIWKEDLSSRKRAKIIQPLLKETKVREIKGKAREELSQDFSSGKGWYRGAQVDRLSEEEAAINAGRLLRKIRELISLTDEKARTLQKAFTSAMAHKLTSNGSMEDLQEELIRICHDNMDEKDLAVLRQAHEKGAFSHLSGE